MTYVFWVAWGADFMSPVFRCSTHCSLETLCTKDGWSRQYKCGTHYQILLSKLNFFCPLSFTICWSFGTLMTCAADVSWVVLLAALVCTFFNKAGGDGINHHVSLSSRLISFLQYNFHSGPQGYLLDLAFSTHCFIRVGWIRKAFINWVVAKKAISHISFQGYDWQDLSLSFEA